LLNCVIIAHVLYDAFFIFYMVGGYSAFDVKVMLCPCLCLIVMVVIVKELLKGLPWELVCMDDLILMADTEASLRKKIAKCKLVMQIKGQKMNSGK